MLKDSFLGFFKKYPIKNRFVSLFNRLLLTGTKQGLTKSRKQSLPRHFELIMRLALYMKKYNKIRYVPDG